MSVPYRRAILLAVALLIAVACASLPPIAQDSRYHALRQFWRTVGIPNFWNVVSNIPFLLAALYGLSAFRNPGAFTQRWEGVAFAITIAGTAAVAAGSTWYHVDPTNYTLLWDRLPMTVVFTALLAATIGERVDPQYGRYLLFPLIGCGILSVLDWRITGDLRVYAGVQFGSALTIAFLPSMFPRTLHSIQSALVCASPSTRSRNSRNNSTDQSPPSPCVADIRGNTFWLPRRWPPMYVWWRYAGCARAYKSQRDASAEKPSTLPRCFLINHLLPEAFRYVEVALSPNGRFCVCRLLAANHPGMSRWDCRHSYGCAGRRVPPRAARTAKHGHETFYTCTQVDDGRAAKLYT